MTEATERSPETVKDRDRIVNLSDGVFAIAITLLVLDIRVPDIPEGMVAAELPAALLIPMAQVFWLRLELRGHKHLWVIHHSTFRPIRAYDRGSSTSTFCN